MRKLVSILFFVSFTVVVSAQVNLVPNPSFEYYTSCPTTTGQIQKAFPWFMPHFKNPTEEYYNACEPSHLVGVPDNVFGYTYAHQGIAYAGFGIQMNGLNYREYIEAPLEESLIANKKYCVEFYAIFANKNPYMIDAIGAYLSKDSIIDTTYKVLPYVSQINNPIGNIISDTLGWVKISGEFIAEGGEKFITIGNFKDDAHTNAIYIGGDSILKQAYYFIDDVSVTLIGDSKSCGTGVEEKENKAGIVLYPNPVSNIINIELKELRITNYKLRIYDLCGRLVLEKTLTDRRQTINVNGLQDGIYFYKITEGNAVIESDKLVIIR